MNGYLFDTNTLWWAFEGERRLPPRVAGMIEDTAGELWVSVVSYWELQVKQNIGKLIVTADYNERLCEWLQAGQVKWMTITRRHCDQYRLLPL